MVHSVGAAGSCCAAFCAAAHGAETKTAFGTTMGLSALVAPTGAAFLGCLEPPFCGGGGPAEASGVDGLCGSFLGSMKSSGVDGMRLRTSPPLAAAACRSAGAVLLADASVMACDVTLPLASTLSHTGPMQ